jgi:hypothetical protein
MTAERMSSYIKNQLNAKYEIIAGLRTEFANDTAGFFKSHAPILGAKPRALFDKYVEDGYNAKYHGTTVDFDLKDLDPRILKAIDALHDLRQKEIELGKRSGDMFGIKGTNLIDKDWEPVDHEFTRMIDKGAWRDFIGNFKASGNDAEARKFLEDYVRDSMNAKADVIEAKINRNRELSYKKALAEAVANKKDTADIPTPEKATPKDVADYINEHAKPWSDRAVDMLNDRDIDSTEANLGNLRFYKERVPMDTGLVKLLPNGKEFSFDNNLRSYDLDGQIFRQINRMSGEAGVKNVFGTQQRMQKFKERISSELQTAVQNGDINASTRANTETVVDDLFNELRGKRTRRENLSATGAVGNILGDYAYVKKGVMMGFSQYGDVGGAVAYGGANQLLSTFKPLNDWVRRARLGKLSAQEMADAEGYIFGSTLERHIFDSNWGNRIVRTSITKDGLSGDAIRGTADFVHDLGKITSFANQLGAMTDNMLHASRTEALLDLIKYAHNTEVVGSSIKVPNSVKMSAAKVGALGREVNIKALTDAVKKYIPYDAVKGEAHPSPELMDKWRDAEPQTFWQMYDLIQNQAERSVALSTSKGARNLMKDQNAITRMLFKFKDFSYRTSASAFARGINARDYDDGFAFLMSMLTNLAAYSARGATIAGAYAAIGQSQMAQDYVDKYLNTAQLARAAFLRSSFTSPASNANDIIETVTGAPTIRTTVDDSGRKPSLPNNAGDIIGRVLGNTPAMDMGASLTLKPLLGAYYYSQGRNTQKDLRNFLDLAPIPNLPVYSQFLDAISKQSSLPEKRPRG